MLKSLTRMYIIIFTLQCYVCFAYLYRYTKMFYVSREFSANKLEKCHPFIILLCCIVYYIISRKYFVQVYENDSKELARCIPKFEIINAIIREERTLQTFIIPTFILKYILVVLRPTVSLIMIEKIIFNEPCRSLIINLICNINA